MDEIRLLTPSDRAALESFLRDNTPQAMFLRSNLAQSGIADGHQPYQGQYAGRFENGRLVGVVAHYWNRMLVLMSPEHPGDVAQLASAGRKIDGILGPWRQVLDAQETLGIDGVQRILRTKEALMTLPLDRLQDPAPLLEGQSLHCRLATPADATLLTEWRMQFRREALDATPSHRLTQLSAAEVSLWIEEKKQFILFDGDHPVAGCTFNARVPDAVQIGNVFTLPQLRSRGYGRAVVAGALRHAREAGATLGVLYAAADNIAAQTAYLTLGFSAVGEYAILLFKRHGVES